ncbi:MAG: LytR C-terminal domain-containing protein [Rhodococcus sp.]|nr:LytR C-terminal domain-containing protein [Rhodococcus sp. (in: high G+C Gram-positive bacteria)]
MLFISLAVVFGGLGLASLGSSDASEPAPAAAESELEPTSAAPAPTSARPLQADAADSEATTTPSGTTTSGSSTSTAGNLASSVSVRVFNNSSVTGLAAQTAQKLITAGWTVAETGNYSDSTVGATTVYYGNSANEKEAAEEIADTLGVSAKPRIAGLSNSSAGVIVIVTND